MKSPGCVRCTASSLPAVTLCRTSVDVARHATPLSKTRCTDKQHALPNHPPFSPVMPTAAPLFPLFQATTRLEYPASYANWVYDHPQSLYHYRFLWPSLQSNSLSIWISGCLWIQWKFVEFQSLQHHWKNQRCYIDWNFENFHRTSDFHWFEF